MMETIVRRGRVKGFIPWLITQRPAVLSKDVLSQADGVIAFKLTAPQNRAAIGAWIERQADQQEGKAILASLPAMQRGQGVILVPGRGILKTDDFLAKPRGWARAHVGSEGFVMPVLKEETAGEIDTDNTAVMLRYEELRGGRRR